MQIDALRNTYYYESIKAVANVQSGTVSCPEGADDKPTRTIQMRRKLPTVSLKRKSERSRLMN